MIIFYFYFWLFARLSDYLFDGFPSMPRLASPILSCLLLFPGLCMFVICCFVFVCSLIGAYLFFVNFSRMFVWFVPHWSLLPRFHCHSVEFLSFLSGGRNSYIDVLFACFSICLVFSLLYLQRSQFLNSGNLSTFHHIIL